MIASVLVDMCAVPLLCTLQFDLFHPQIRGHHDHRGKPRLIGKVRLAIDEGIG